MPITELLYQAAVALTLTQTPPDSISIEMDRLAVLTSSANGECIIEKELTYGLQDTRGRFIIYATTTDHLTVYSSSGRCIGEVGRNGSGPGEYRELAWARPLGDSIFVYDLGNNRVTVLGPDFEVVREFRPDGLLGMRIQLSANAELVINGQVRTPEAAGFPLHRYSSEGQYIGSFGVAPIRFVAGSSISSRRFHLIENEVWETWPYDFVFRLWSADGTLERTLVAERPNWFPDPDITFDYSLRSPPRPVVEDIWVTPNSQMWIHIRVPADDWKKAITEEGGRRRVKNSLDFQHSLLQVVDTRTGKTLAEKKLNGYATMVYPGMVGIMMYDDNMELVYTIFRPRVAVNSNPAR